MARPVGDGDTTTGDDTMSEAGHSSGRARSVARTIAWAVGGGFAGVALVAIAGYLDLHASATSSGAILDLHNNVVAIAPPAVPWLSLLSLAVLGWLVSYFVIAIVGRAGPSHQFASALAFTATVTCLIVWSVAHYPLAGDTADTSETALSAIRDWLEKGGTLSIVHVLAPLPMVAWFYRIGSRRREVHT